MGSKGTGADLAFNSRRWLRTIPKIWVHRETIAYQPSHSFSITSTHQHATYLSMISDSLKSRVCYLKLVQVQVHRRYQLKNELCETSVEWSTAVVTHPLGHQLDNLTQRVIRLLHDFPGQVARGWFVIDPFVVDLFKDAEDPRLSIGEAETDFMAPTVNHRMSE